MNRRDSLTPLRDALEEAGFSIALIESRIEADIGTSIIRAIESADVLLCVGHAERPWIAAEVAHATAAKIPVVVAAPDDGVGALVQRVRDAVPRIRTPVPLVSGLTVTLSGTLIAILAQGLVLKTWSAALIALGLVLWIYKLELRFYDPIEGARQRDWEGTVADIWAEVDRDGVYYHSSGVSPDHALVLFGCPIAAAVLLTLVIIGVIVDVARIVW